MRTIDMNRIATELKPKQRIASAIRRLTQAATVMLLLTLAGCNDNTADIFGNGKDIAFSTDINQTRAASFTETGGTAYKTMGVYAANHNSADFSGTTPVSLMTNVKIERDNGSNGWYYSPPAMWRGTEKHSFFAYAPYNPTGLTLPGTAIAGIPTMQYIVPDDVASQVDLLVAAPQYNLVDNLTPSVKLTMNHALTRVVFSARVLHSVPTGSSIKITEIKLTDIANQATRPMAFEATDLWTGQTGTATYTLTNGVGGGLQNVALTQTLTEIETPDGNLFLMPQSFTANDAATLSITYVLDDGATQTTETLTKPIAHFLEEWRQSEAIRLLITVPNAATPAEFTVDVSYVAWDDRELNVEIPSDPFLDVTNVEVHAYDAAATRVYFYTNQPRMLDGNPNVYIDHQGRVGLATGAAFNVHEEFHALTTVDPAGATNFHFDDVTHKGYFDLINVNTSTAGDRPNNGKKLLILKLRAGKLVRDIAVQPVVTTEAAKGIAVPYVGTFHRHTEMGERIVTWHLPQTTMWTATIDNTTGNYADLCIDRLASPDFAGNVLFSFAPRDAEGAKVDPAKNGANASSDDRSVSGKGRVYFRVGWKSTSPTTNRYARINVTGTDVGGSGIHAVTIYCRQGETEEPITGSTTIQFAVYNTAQPRTLAQYPSQVGMQYQWNRMKAWDPLSKTTPPGFPLPTNPDPYKYDITVPFSPENNACPEGYLYPNQQALNDMSQIITLFSNSFSWGYMADGFFDRRSINPTDNRVEASTLDVASAGYVLRAPDLVIGGGGAPKSIFLTTGGDRDGAGELINIGAQGIYWSQEVDNAATGAIKVGIFHKNGTKTVTTPHEMWHTHSLRCIKPAANEVWIIRFDANGGENAPLSLTVPRTAGSVKIPTTPPDNYWRDGYEFDKYTESKSGTGTAILPGGTFTPTADVTTLYAQWKPEVFRIVDFRNHTGALAYTQSGSPSYTSYNGYTIGTGTNGTLYTSANAITNITSGEKAYPKLEWSDVQGTENWATAYANCKAYTNGSADAPGSWRLPRAIELYLVGLGSPVNALKDKVTGVLWTGTEKNTTYAWGQYNSSNPLWNFTKNGADGPQPYRCVKELIP